MIHSSWCFACAHLQTYFILTYWHAALRSLQCILSPANELVNVTRGGCDRCPLWAVPLCQWRTLLMKYPPGSSQVLPDKAYFKRGVCKLSAFIFNLRLNAYTAEKKNLIWQWQLKSILLRLIDISWKKIQLFILKYKTNSNLSYCIGFLHCNIKFVHYSSSFQALSQKFGWICI